MNKWPPVPFFVSSIILLVVGVLTTLTLACPIDGGTGYLEAAQDLTVKDVSVKLTKEVPVYTFGECGVAVERSKFTYDVSMTLTNNGAEESRGTLTVAFSRYAAGSKQYAQDAEGNMVEVDYMPPTVPAFVDVPAGMTKDVRLKLTYIDDPLADGEGAPEISVKAGENMVDPTCGGTGELSFVEWIAAKLRPPSFE